MKLSDYGFLLLFVTWCFCLIWIYLITIKLKISDVTAEYSSLLTLQKSVHPLKTINILEKRNEIQHEQKKKRNVDLDSQTTLFKPPEKLPTLTFELPDFSQFHNSNPKCEQWYDFGFLKRWTSPEKNKLLCENKGTFLENPSEIDCFQVRHPNLNKPTAPHVICRGKNIIIDESKKRLASCLKHRPGYMCEGEKTYNIYKKGTFSGNCQPSWNLQDDFPADHLRDIFDSFSPIISEEMFTQNVKIYEDRIVLFITREKGEHVNVFHSMSDWFITFQTIIALKIDINKAQILILDDHVQGPLDNFFQTVFTPNYPVLRWSDVQDSFHLYRDVVWIPPGYSNILIADVGKICGSCCEKLEIFEHFANLVLKNFKLKHKKSESEIIRITYIPRRPYNLATVEHSFMSRQISNEEEFIEKMQTMKNTEINIVDFAKITLREQMSAIAEETDVVIGMHGAGLSHIAWLPPYGALFELFPNNKGRWWCFRHIAQWRGLEYDDWFNRLHPKHFKKTKDGDWTKINMDEVIPKLEELLIRIRKKKLEFMKTNF